MTSTDQLYPFPAVLGGDPDAPGGLDDMALALVLSVIDPGIGGVLVRGAAEVAGRALMFAKLTRADIERVLVNGTAGLLSRTNGRPTGLLTVTVVNGLVVELDVIVRGA